MPLYAQKRLERIDSDGVMSTAAQEKIRNEDYTVGWICAITTEYVAAQSFLDAEHNPPEYVAPNDSNDYTLGRIGKHNVVIAVLPKGGYGIASAAHAASNMLHSFENVRIGLMVGIGGGAPSSEHDIRLGDIVVSSPYTKEGGVLQYKFGKANQGRKFEMTGHLNQPPTVLRTAVSGLEAQYQRRGHQFEEIINNVLENNPRLKKKYKRPDPNTDRLYLSTVKHPVKNSKANCDEACGSDASRLIRRDPRDQNENNPAVHHGIIASADTLMKDALLRDKFAKEHDVLCFEMEAAGLMNDFPCLVIRGICDYSDSHKNKEWQGYAAMTAAAYAKDLLTRIPVNKIEAEKRINDVLSSVEQNVYEISRNVQDLERGWRRTEIHDWLSPPDPSTNYNKALQQRQKGTGLWFLQSDAFATWRSQRNSFQWLHGIPGCGKTFLSTAIIEELERTVPRQSLLYFYFDFSDTHKQAFQSMVRSLVSQLYYKHEHAAKQLESLFSSCQNGRQPTSESLCKVLLHQIEQVKEVWIVLDALDECITREGPPTEGLLSWIREVLHSEQRNVHLLVTSRQVQDIESRILEFAPNDSVVPIQSSAVSDDIREYARARIRGENPLKRWRNRPDVQQEIETRLMEKADGMFRWVACQLDALENCLDYRALKLALASLPRTLDETYARILNGIHPEHKQTATRILQFLLYSERPLRIEEVDDAIAVDIEGDPYFDPNYRMPDRREISSYCSSLVAVVSAEDHSPMGLQLAHFSVKEYLTSNRLPEDIAQDFQEVNAKASIAKVCLAYLLHLDQNNSRKAIKKTFPLAKYSARYWMDHAAIAESKDRRLQGFIQKLFCHHKNAYRNYHRLYWLDEIFSLEPEEPIPPLYYASFGGLVNTVEYLLSQGADVNAKVGYYGSALGAASKQGHEKVVKLLLKAGANVNTQCEYGTALQLASLGGHEKVVKLLLHAGASVNARGRNFAALQAASVSGHEKIVKLLLHAGASVNAQGKYGTALQRASWEGHEKIVKLLLHAGANVNAQGTYGTALQLASCDGHKKIVELLLKAGASVNAQGEYSTALQLASKRGHEKIVELLLQAGARVNAQGEDRTALQLALFGGHKKIVKLLLHAGANFNTQDEYITALQLALKRGHVKIVELLFRAGARVNNRQGKYDTALQQAL